MHLERREPSDADRQRAINALKARQKLAGVHGEIVKPPERPAKDERAAEKKSTDIDEKKTPEQFRKEGLM